jgi:hypothetical protein
MSGYLMKPGRRCTVVYDSTSMATEAKCEGAVDLVDESVHGTTGRRG